jgi:hypothetical protein
MGLQQAVGQLMEEGGHGIRIDEWGGKCKKRAVKVAL